MTSVLPRNPSRRILRRLNEKDHEQREKEEREKVCLFPTVHPDSRH